MYKYSYFSYVLVSFELDIGGGVVGRSCFFKLIIFQEFCQKCQRKYRVFQVFGIWFIWSIGVEDDLQEFFFRFFIYFINVEVEIQKWNKVSEGFYLLMLFYFIVFFEISEEERILGLLS